MAEQGEGTVIKMSIDYQHSILWRGVDPVNNRFKPKYDGSKKTVRYWPGKAPSWTEKEKDADEQEQEVDKLQTKQKKRLAPIGDAASSRLKRLMASQLEGDGQGRLLRHRVIHDARVVEAAEEEEKKDHEISEEHGGQESFLAHGPKIEDFELDGKRSIANLQYDEISGSDEDDKELKGMRRERAREVALVKRKEEEELLKDEIDDDGEDELEEESDDETDSDDDDPRRNAMLKPIFVSKTQRDTVKEKEFAKKEEEEAKEREKEKLKERKVESKTLVIEEIRRDEEAEQNGLNENDVSDIELIDDNDEKNEAEEYELWKIRELKRIKRDRGERLAREQEIEWIMKRRSMTEEERIADDRRLDEDANKRDEVKSFGFLQKYYHRGAFFMEKAVSGEEPLYLRDYHEPTEEEKFDKNLLPKAMQLRRGQFGKKGQVKHTHLTEVDTTDMSAAWAQNSKLVQRYQEKMASAKGVVNFERPSSSSKTSGG